MPTVIKLQNNFINGFIPILVLFIILISPLIYKLIKKSKDKKKTEPFQDVNTLPKAKPLPLSIKEVYIKRLNELCNSIDDGTITVREGYIRLSTFIREFVLEYEGIDVTTKTLAELRAYDLPKLTALVEEYYVPEFSLDSGSDYKKSISNTIKVINTWN